MVETLTEVQDVLRRCWAESSCDPAVPWDPGNPAAGHCSVTAMAVVELFGGVLLCAEVFLAGERICLHYWNRLPSGLELDLTREQFRRGEHIGKPTVQQPILTPTARMAQHYDRYAARVRAQLGGPLPAGLPTAVPS